MIGVLLKLLEVLAALALAPLLLGWVNQCRAWLSNRRAPPLTQPYRQFAKLLAKDAVIAHEASVLFRTVPYLQFALMLTAAGIIPIFALGSSGAGTADVIALVGAFALARVLIALAAMDVGTAFGSLGARREMMLGFLAEPALLMVVFTHALIVGSTNPAQIAAALAQMDLQLYPSLAFAAAAFVMVLLAENARIPIDNPATHLELTMVHEAMILEYSGRHLALIEWASALKLFNFVAIGAALFLPWGMARPDVPADLLLALPALLIKLTAAGAGLALIETVSAKLRLFRAPEFLVVAFLLAVLGLLVRLLLGA